LGNNFKKAGDINKASQGLSQKDFKILMSHDRTGNMKKDHDKIFISRFPVIPTTEWFTEIPDISNGVGAICVQTMGRIENMGRYVYVNRGWISRLSGE
jgi:hypothetical protein